MMVDTYQAVPPMPHPRLEVVELDVSSDVSIGLAKRTVEEKLGRLDG